MDYEDALLEVENTLEKIGFPDLMLSETYSLDVDTMREHYELYQDSRSYYGEKGVEVDWSPEDEAYLFSFQQQVDGLSISNRAIRGTTSTLATVYYTKDGIQDIQAYNFFDMIENSEERDFISLEAALEVVVSDYEDMILKNEHRVVFTDLNYITEALEDGHYELVPAWIFQIAEQYEETDSNDHSKQVLDRYDYVVVDAMTGEKIEWEIEGP